VDGDRLQAARPGEVELVAGLLSEALRSPAAVAAQRASLTERAARNAELARAGLDAILELATAAQR
jgi:hypothetical protein